MTSIILTDRLRQTYPGFKLAWARLSGMDNSSLNPQVAAIVRGLPSIVRGGAEALLKKTEPMEGFFRQLNNRAKYHIGSLIKATLNGRQYVSINPAVDLLYAVELETATLMSMHDASTLSDELHVDVNLESRGMNHISGRTISVPPTDIVVRDETTVLAAITVGIAGAAKVTESTRDAVVIAYGSPHDEETFLQDALHLACERFPLFTSASCTEAVIVIA